MFTTRTGILVLRTLSLHKLTIFSEHSPCALLGDAAVRGEGKGKSEGEADCTAYKEEHSTLPSVLRMHCCLQAAG